MIQSRAFDSVQKKDDENQEEKPNVHLSQTLNDGRSTTEDVATHVNSTVSTDAV